MTRDTLVIDAETLDARKRHHLLLSAVAPRPIAWVSTLSGAGVRNLAPFSYFQALCGTPPYLMISVGRRAGAPKDTLRNIEETGAFVVNLVPETLAEQMNHSAGEYAAHVDEFAVSGVTPAPCTLVAPPRVAESPVSMEVRLEQLLPLAGSDYTVVIGRVLLWHVDPAILTADGLIDIERLRPVSRLSRDDYVTFGRLFSLARPDRDTVARVNAQGATSPRN